MESRIMIIDDEANILQALRRLLNAAPCAYGKFSFDLYVETYVSAKGALEHARNHPFDMFISDYRMPEMDGVSLLKQIRETQPDAVYLILSGYADLNGLMRAINEVGIGRFISKPWNDYELVSTIAQTLSSRALMQENRQLANLMRRDCGDITPQAYEESLLESIEPGITKVNWGPDGSVLLEVEETTAPLPPPHH
jgi:two-component system, probable response regulator PhcQ